MRGVPVKGHPVLEELVKLRTLMEKMKPIDQKLQYQVEKLLKAHEGKEQLATQRLRANLEGMGKHDAEDDKEEIEDAAEDDGIYRPPKIASAVFSDENERTKADKELEKKKIRLKKSEMLPATMAFTSGSSPQNDELMNILMNFLMYFGAHFQNKHTK